jgi:hypothetical protein
MVNSLKTAASALYGREATVKYACTYGWIQDGDLLIGDCDLCWLGLMRNT